MQKIPVIILNYKTYVESTGLKGRVLTRMTHEVMKEKGVRMVVCPQTPDLYLHWYSGIEVFAQHVDPVDRAATRATCSRWRWSRPASPAR